MLKNCFKNKYNKGPSRINYSSGVTLLELIVVIFIFTVISSVTIFNYTKFNSSLSLQNLADDIALSVRRAQGYAIGVRGYQGSFERQYGVRFTANPSSSSYAGSRKSFILFNDINGDNVYDNSNNTCGTPTLGDECLELLSITSADNITAVYLEIGGSTITLPATDTVDLVFTRPNPEPIFCHRSGGGCLSETISSIKIRISTDVDASIYKTITIYNNGQISVS